MERKAVYHAVFLICFTVFVLGSFEHNLELQQYLPDWHWFWSSQFPLFPHHQWWGAIGAGTSYLLLSSDYYIEIIKRFISVDKD